jgi:hypothetical protein
MARNRALKIALTISVLFHLSMVTLFRIVIYFPREDIEFYAFEIVEQPRTMAVSGAFTERLRVPTAEGALEAFSGGEEPSEWAPIPPIELPTVAFAGLERLRLRQQSLDISQQFNGRAPDEPADSWARFGEGLNSLTDALSRRILGQELEEAPGPARVQDPAPGFVAFVEWMEPPYGRELLYAPPADVLRGVHSLGHLQPLTLVFRVSAEGRIVEVLTPAEDDAGIVEGMAETLLSYRFAPLAGTEMRDQRGSLIVTREAVE